MGFLQPAMSEHELNKMGILAVAQVGDAVFELMARVRLCRKYPTARLLHRARVEYVNAAAQAGAARRIDGHFTESERDVFKRARNADPGAVPKSVSREVYQAATGLEAVCGWLYLTGDLERLEQLFDVIWSDDNG